MTSTLICLDCHTTHLMDLEKHDPTEQWLKHHAGDNLGVEVED